MCFLRDSKIWKSLYLKWVLRRVAHNPPFSCSAVNSHKPGWWCGSYWFKCLLDPSRTTWLSSDFGTDADVKEGVTSWLQFDIDFFCAEIRTLGPLLGSSLDDLSDPNGILFGVCQGFRRVKRAGCVMLNIWVHLIYKLQLNCPSRMHAPRLFFLINLLKPSGNFTYDEVQY
jgi:hypothetical protein